MTGLFRRIAMLSVGLLSALALLSAGVTVAQENPPPKPVAIPCATDVSAQVLGMSPIGDGSESLVLARIIIGPGGSIGAHTHPGTLVATVESGSLGFTLIDDGEMAVNRAATADAEASSEPLPQNEEVALEPGDWFVETGMVHSAANLSDGQTTVLLSGLITTGEPLTQCVDPEATPASTSHHE